MTASPTAIREVWYHALGARVGGGLTYLRAVLPRLRRVLSARGIRTVLLSAGPVEGPGFEPGEDLEVRALAAAAAGPVARARFDQSTLPRLLAGRRDAVLFCSGSFGPVRPPVPSVVLLRNAIWFDPGVAAMGTRLRALRLAVERRLVLGSAAAAARIHYPTEHFRATVEAVRPGLAARGRVNPYGLPAWTRTPARRRPPGEPPTFLYVLTYTVHKDLGCVLRALAMARREGVAARVVVTTDMSDPPPGVGAADRRLVEANALVREGRLVLAGTVDGEALRRLYDEVDGCLFVSRCESFGHPVAEALLLGRPLVCADLPYAREIAGDDAIWVRPGRPEDLLAVWRDWPALESAHVPADPAPLARRFSWDRHVEVLAADLIAAGSA